MGTYLTKRDFKQSDGRHKALCQLVPVEFLHFVHPFAQLDKVVEPQVLAETNACLKIVGQKDLP